METALQFITKSHFLPIEAALTLGILLYGLAIYQKAFERCSTGNGQSVVHVFSKTERIARALSVAGKLIISVNAALLGLSLLQRVL